MGDREQRMGDKEQRREAGNSGRETMNRDVRQGKRIETRKRHGSIPIK
jgi:hypothetical protein